MSRFFTAIIPLLVILVFSTGFAGEEDVDLNKLNEGLVMAVRSDHEGLQLSALMLIIEHSDKLKVDQLSNDIYNIYSSHENDKFRQLALIALHKMNNRRILKNLVFDIDNESNPIIRHQIATILNEMPPFYAGY